MFNKTENCGYKIHNNKHIREVFLSEDSYNYTFEENSLVSKNENIIFNILIYLYGLLNANFPFHKEYNTWSGMEKGPSLEPYCVIYDKKNNLCVSDNLIFPSLDGLVSDQIKEVKKAYKDLKQIINDYSLNNLINVKCIIDYSHRYDKKPDINQEYDKVDLPYKYFSKKWVCIRLTLNLNNLTDVYSGFFRLMGNNKLIEKHAFDSICPLYVYE